MEPVDFNAMNETDVREILVRPFLHRLGYQHGTESTIRTEVSLRYGNAFLGRKNPSKDPPLIGRADYICEVVSFARWAVEVKSPNEEITTDTIEQAHTYAAHPEIAAEYFLVTNGRRWCLFRTSRLEEPALEWRYEESEERLLAVYNLLSPDALRKRAALSRPDIGKPLGRGLASRMEVIGGEVIYEDHVADHPLLRSTDINGLTLPIVDGLVERDADGRICARIRMASAAPMMKELREAIGDDENHSFYSADEFVSTDVNKPTIFQHFYERTVPAGTPIALIGLNRPGSVGGWLT